MTQPSTTGKTEARLRALGLTLPEAAAPVANYVPYVRTGDLLFISGQISRSADAAVTGILGDGLDLAAGREAARLAALNLIAQAKAALDGDLDRVRRCVKLTGFVAATPGFTQMPDVINGASDLMVEIFGEAGRHARAAVGAPSLPLGVAVEIDGVFEVA